MPCTPVLSTGILVAEDGVGVVEGNAFRTGHQAAESDRIKLVAQEPHAAIDHDGVAAAAMEAERFVVAAAIVLRPTATAALGALHTAPWTARAGDRTPPIG